MPDMKKPACCGGFLVRKSELEQWGFIKGFLKCVEKTTNIHKGEVVVFLEKNDKIDDVAAVGIYGRVQRPPGVGKKCSLVKSR